MREKNIIIGCAVLALLLGACAKEEPQDKFRIMAVDRNYQNNEIASNLDKKTCEDKARFMRDELDYVAFCWPQ